MNRVVVLISLLIEVLSVYGQQQVQWYDVSNFAPVVKQCKVCFTEDKLYVYVNTGDKDVNFWVGEPQRTGALMVLNDNDMMELRQAFFNEFIEQSLNDLPANATVQSHVQHSTEDYEIDPLENLEVVFHRVDKEQLDKGLSTENISANHANQRNGNRTENARNSVSGVMQSSNSGLAQQQGNQEISQSEGNNIGQDEILGNILALVIGYWLLKALLKEFFSSSSSKKSSSEKDYEDGPAWFHDHGKNI